MSAKKINATMFQCKRDFENYYCRARDVSFSRTLNLDLKTFAQWRS